MLKHINSGRAMSIPAGLALGAAVSMAITIGISFIGAQLIINEVMSHDNIGYCSLAALLFGAMFGGITSSGKIKRRKLLMCFISGGIYILILLSVTALFFGGQLQGVLVTVITITCGTISAVLIQGRGAKQNKVRRRKNI